MAEKEVKKLNTGGKFIKSQAILSIFELFKKPFIHIILIIILGLLVYSNTFIVPFQFDDTPNIVENYKLRDLSNSWPPSGSRWAGFLTFALNYHFGGLNVTGYHIFNLAIHILNAILVYWLVMLTFKTPHLSLRGTKSRSNPDREIATLPSVARNDKTIKHIALFSALIFVAHPIQTQAVTYIVQRFTSLATFFYLLSLVMYIKARLEISEHRAQSTDDKTSCHSCESRNPGTKDWIPVSTGTTDMSGKRLHKIFSLKSVFWYLGSVFCAVLAMKTKEIAFTLPLIITLYEFMFFNGKIKKRVLYLIPLILIMLIIPLSMIGIDKSIGDAIGELREATQETEEIPRWSYLFTQFRIIVTYIRLLFLPINQNLDYDYPIYHSFFEPNVFLSFLFLLVIFGIGVYLLYRLRFTSLRAEQAPPLHPTIPYTLPPTRLIAFGILWFFITLSVESSVIPIRDVIFEHRLYLPSVGAVIAFSIAIFYALQFTVHRLRISTSYFSLLTSYFLLLSTIIIALAIATYQRNTVWKDEVRLWKDVVRKSTDKPRGHYELGNAYSNKSLIDKAIEHYQFVLRLKPDYTSAYNNLGIAYYKKGWIDEAVKHYQIALKLQPEHAKLHNNLGIAYQSKGLIEKAIEHYQIALRLKPDFAEAHYNLGIAYYAIGWLDKAIEHYHIALSLNLMYAAVHYNLGVAYQEKGWVDKAIEQYGAALKLNPNDADTHNNLGTAYENKGLLDEAIKEYLVALKLNPEDGVVRNNLNRVLQIKRK